MRRPRVIAALLALLLAGACRSSTAPEPVLHSMEIAPATVTCYGLYERQCLHVRIDGNAEWRYFYDSIQGFTYEPGYRYVVTYFQREIENPPQDGSSASYHLVKVVSKVRE
jgi:hypothetical protein